MDKENPIQAKPWGFYVDIFRQEDIVFKKIIIYPNEEISYQHHESRTEFWLVSSGKGVLTKGGFDHSLVSGDWVVIKEGEDHKVANGGEDDLIIYEMQAGLCKEDDIVRITDKYNR
jgi:mannose-6-phosphate isomerase-like protein (cupin superfamily)